jgi:hypothetical protein
MYDFGLLPSYLWRSIQVQYARLAMNKTTLSRRRWK